MQFWQPGRLFAAQDPKVILQSRKKATFRFFFQKNSPKVPLDTNKAILTNLSKIICSNSQNFSRSKTQNLYKIDFCQTKLHHMLVWTGRIQLWPPRLWFLAQSPEIFRSKPLNFFSAINLTEMFLQQKGCSFDKTVENCLSEVWKIFGQKSRKYMIFLEKKLTKVVLCTSSMQLWQRAENITLKFR